MNRFLKGTFIFTGGVAGGFVLCGATIGKLLIQSNTFREAVKNKISDEVTNFLYGETKRSKIGYKPYKVSYRDYYTGRKIETPYCDDIIFDNRGEAEEVLSDVLDIFIDYGSVSVADLHDLCGVPSAYKDNHIGWKDADSINRAYVISNRNGYRIILPKPVELA